MAAQHATEFEKIINAGRERKKNEALAARIFKKTKDNKRRASAPSAGSLASRAGVNKRVSSGARPSAGNINGEWAHDLHNSRTKNAKARQDPNSLAARIHAPGTTLPRSKNNQRNTRPNRAAQLANAFERTTSSPATAKQHMNVQQSSTAQSSRQGMTIRGLAGPSAVMAQNFAPGTTAADIESAMTPVGGIVSSCRLVKTQPIVIAEIIFESKEGADRVVEMFNNKTADGRTIQVYPKPDSAYRTPAVPVPTGPRAQRGHENRSGGNNVIVDGSMGFDDVMDTDLFDDRSSNGGLYSDSMVPKSRANGTNGYNNSRRGRGFRSGR
ncbi:hypothetical protein GGR54DRAFT_182248 [Hypoxylon sp. NC1633]|nr:hypothetical protein GGR54DRAFT_182248 [Hypoxylon sp. NC1633]